MTTTTHTSAATGPREAKGSSLDALRNRFFLRRSERPQRRAFARTVAAYPATRSAAGIAALTQR